MKKFFSAVVICSAWLIAVNPITAKACTSWMIFSDLTKNGTNILHKNRDAVSRKIAVYLSNAESARKWVGMGNNNALCMGMNASGLAIIMNSGEVSFDYSDDKTRMSTSEIVLKMLESCDTAAQAVDMMKDIVKNSKYRHGEKKGSTFFFCDRNEGYVFEMTPKYYSVQKYNDGFTVRANIWQNPGMYQISRSNIKWHLNSSARAFIAISELNKAIDKHNKITLLDIFDLSRHYLMPETSSQKRSVCFRATNSTSSLEIDKQYPDILSTAYFTIGHPRHTVYVPIPVCVEKILPSMGNLKWSAAAWKRFDELKLEAPIPAEWTKFEKDSMAVYQKAQSDARKLLDAGKRAEAVKLMNSTAEKIWINAEKLLNI